MGDYDINFPTLPNNIVEYLKQHSAIVRCDLISGDAINGYGFSFVRRITVLEYAKWCTRPNCNYHSILHPIIRDEDCCSRHSYAKGYVETFSWDEIYTQTKESLEEAFDNWLKTKEGAK